MNKRLGNGYLPATGWLRCAHCLGFLLLLLGGRLAAAEPAVGWLSTPFYSRSNLLAGQGNIVTIVGSLGLRDDGTLAFDAAKFGTNLSSLLRGASNIVALAPRLLLHANGTVVQWAQNSELPNHYYSRQMNVPPDLSNVVAVATGSYHSLALRSDGTVVAWGGDVFGESDVPAGLNRVMAIAAGNEFSLALRADGTVVAWGYNRAGDCNVPAGLSNVVAIAAGTDQNLALRRDGTVIAWPGETNRLAGLTNVIAIADFSKVLCGDGTLFDTTGNRLAGWSNVVAITPSAVLVGYPGGMAAPSVVASGVAFGMVDHYFQYRITALHGPTGYAATGLPPGLSLDAVTGLISGYPTQGGWYEVQLSVTNAVGQGQGSARFYIGLPLPTVRFEKLKVVLGNEVNCQVVYDGDWQVASGLPAGLSLDQATGKIRGIPEVVGNYTVSILASNRYGVAALTLPVRVSPVVTVDIVTVQDPNNPLPWYPMPEPDDLGEVVQIASGYYHNVALMADGTVAAWGTDEGGRVPYAVPTNVPPGLTNVIAVEAGSLHNLALRADGTVIAWGDNKYGQTNVPVGLSNVVAVAAGSGHNLALLANGTVVAWGKNTSGESNVPPDLRNVIAVAAGVSFSLALRTDGTLVGWGDSYFLPELVLKGLSNVVAVAVGWYHALVLRADGMAAGWGGGWDGYSEVPPDVNCDVTAVGAGESHSAIVRSNGTVVAWGFNWRGQTNVPPGLSNMVAVTGGIDHTLILAKPRPALAQIVRQPESQILGAGALPSLAVLARCTPPSTYQWQCNGTNIPGATSARCPLDRAQVGNTGNYSVIISNAAGCVTSRLARLEVETARLVALPLGASPAIGTHGFGMGLVGEVGRNFRVQASTNLSEWLDLTNVIGGTGLLEFRDSATNHSRRYYRLVSP